MLYGSSTRKYSPPPAPSPEVRKGAHLILLFPLSHCYEPLQGVPFQVARHCVVQELEGPRLGPSGWDLLLLRSYLPDDDSHLHGVLGQKICPGHFCLPGIMDRLSAREMFPSERNTM